MAFVVEPYAIVAVVSLYVPVAAVNLLSIFLVPTKVLPL